MTKRILSLLLAAMMVLGSLVVVSAAEPDYAAENTWAVEVLTKLNVLQGDENGDPMLDNAILRYEMALFLARALTAKTDDAYWAKVENETPFDDLLTHPYNGAATWNYNHGIIFGVTDTIFNPNGNITYQDAIVMVVRAWADYFLVDGLSGLGIKDELHYPWKHIELADDLGLTANINPTEKYLENTTRGVVAQLVYNLLTWYNGTTLSSLAAANVKVNPLHNTSIGQAKFGLLISAKTGDDFVAAAPSEGNVALDNKDANKGDITLKETEFARFDLTAKQGVVYTIVYYAIGNEVVVTSIKQKTANTADYVNTPADREFAPVYEATAWEDEAKTKPTTWKITGIKAGDKTYPIVGNDALALYIDDVPATGYATTGLNAAAVAAYNAIIDSLYGTLDLIDTDGDGKFNKIVITPFVFAATYKEVRVDAESTTNKATEWKFDGYAVVSYADATKTTTTNYVERTWTWTVADAAGKKDTGATQTITAETAEYVAPVTAETLATATALSAVKVNYFDVDVTETNAGWVQFVDDDTQYAWGYSDLLAWDIIDTTTNAGVASYFNLARVNATTKEATYLVELWSNKNVAKTEDLKDFNNDGKKYQFVNAWVLDGALVAIVPATSTGSTEPTPGGSTTTPEYEGILVLDALKASSDVAIGKDALKIVNGKYYYATKANVDGATKDILVYLADASTYAGYDSTKPGSPVDQENAWYAAEKTKIDTAYGKIVTDLTATSGAVSTTVRFYDIDVNNNYKIVLGTVVTGENYKANVGGAYLVPAKANDETYTTGVAFEYMMDINSSDFIKYSVTKGTTNTVKFAQNIATNNGTWLFVGTDSIEVKTGVPEYGSYFKVASEKNIVKNDKAILVFYSEDADNTDSATDLAQAYDGFKYTMYNNVDYVIYAGVAARNDMKRDGYLYYDVTDLYTGAPGLVSVREDDTAMIAKLEAVTTQVIAAVERTNQHKLLCVYEIEEAAIKAIASLRYGTSAFATTGEDSLADLEDRIAAQYNLTQIAKSQMSANTTKNLVYAITAQGLGTNNIVYNAASTYYVFYTAPTATAAASYVIIICD